MIFRIFFKDSKRASDVEGDKLSYHRDMRTIMVLKRDGTMTACVNLDEVIAVKAQIDSANFKPAEGGR